MPCGWLLVIAADSGTMGDQMLGMNNPLPSGRKERRLLETLRKKGKQKRGEDGRGTPKPEVGAPSSKKSRASRKRWKGEFGFAEQALIACAVLYTGLRVYIWTQTGEFSMI